ncbi:hypothetical protein QVD17_18364 [Tagetes erecta]|uniref:Reverse transcriptase zinc-binding domain-containing protein n=1 Tax=Tagetes erecta TaxID=13708 RepID=A0AAD8KNX8_TARER|nr:hypothetical protein QVD17_18364 [Tagetes erecta]
MKINIFSWKTVLDILLTRVAISQRNIRTTSIMCGLCQAEPETTEHLLTSYMVASRIWHFIGAWVGIRPIFTFSPRDLLTLHDTASIDTTKKKVLNGVIMMASWSLWKARIKAIFKDKPFDVLEPKGNIKSLGYL